MPDESYGEKTEAPTPRRLQEARERGQVPRSADLTAALVLTAGVAALYFGGSHVGGSLMAALKHMLRFGEIHGLPTERLLTEFAAATRSFTLAIAPIVAVVSLTSVLANLIQSGPVFSGHPLKPALEKLNPAKGFGRIFSKRSLARFASNMAKLTAIIWISYVAVRGDFPRIVAMSRMGVGEIVAGGAEVVLGLGLKLALVFIVLAIFDYMYQRWQFMQDLKMTKHEVREEMKRMEGDPLIREHRRHLQRRMAMQRMSTEVPRADAVITNPTHLAIAIRYDAEAMAAPTVVAKGADLMARRIREIAVEHNVPIIEKPDLARAMYRVVELGQEIPVQFYNAVAEVLAFVYRLTNREFTPTAL